MTHPVRSVVFRPRAADKKSITSLVLLLLPDEAGDAVEAEGVWLILLKCVFAINLEEYGRENR